MNIKYIEVVQLNDDVFKVDDIVRITLKQVKYSKGKTNNTQIEGRITFIDPDSVYIDASKRYEANLKEISLDDIKDITMVERKPKKVDDIVIRDGEFKLPKEVDDTNLWI